ncbi:MAG: amino acid adenylation domain-containing protein [Marinosulfonomonas sp.]
MKEPSNSAQTIKKRAPLTQMQRQIWAGQKLFPDQPVYNTAWRFNLGLNVDPKRFRKAFFAVVDELDALRMVVQNYDGTPSLNVLDSLAGTYEDLTVASQDELAVAISERVTRPLDPSKATVLCSLFRVADGSLAWLLNMHHIVNDGQSSLVVFRMVAETYANMGKINWNIEGSKLSFLEHAQSEETGLIDENTRFWDNWQRYAPAPPKLYNRVLTGTCATASERRLRLSNARRERLEELCASPNFAGLSRYQTVFTLFQTALMAWTHRVSSQEHISLGVVTHGRRTPAQRKMAGCFIDIFPLDVTIGPKQSFTELHTVVRQRNLDNLRHAKPGALRPRGKPNYSVVLNAFPVSFPKFNGTKISAEWLGNGCTDPTHALRLNVIDEGAEGQLTLKFLFNCDAVPESRADDAVMNFMNVLDAMLENPNNAINAVPITGSDETASVCIGEKSDPAEEIEDIVVATERLAAAEPDILAIKDDVRSWTRADLDRRANEIADIITKAGIEHGSRVGVHLTRTGDLVAALLGIMKAGAVFVPLDPGQPGARLDAIVNEARLSLILTERIIRRSWPGEIDKIELDDVERSTANYESRHFSGPAYVLFTSGSTGRPKGVVVERTAISQYAHWAQRTYANFPEASWALHSAIGFDLTLTSIFAPLVSGGWVRAYREELTGPDLSVLRVFEDDTVNVVKLTPRHLALALETAGTPQKIQSLVLGGEELSRGLAVRAIEQLGFNVIIHNEYGPTEAVVGCMDHVFDPQNDTGATVPIGRPADDTNITIRDAGLNTVPAGVVGELFISGRSRLAKGYFNAPKETMEKFVPNPKDPNTLMYRSGDLASVRSDGVVLYHGRTDDQLKISGVRIERGEIVDAALKHSGVTECAVALFDAFAKEEKICKRCGISDRVPDIPFNDEGVCRLCSDFEKYREGAAAYFREFEKLKEIVDRAGAARKGDYDCVMLLSGGKDSTYALSRLAELTKRILCLTLDNGYIADGAKENIRRVTEQLGVDHRFLTTPAMNEIFVDSLKRHANVCNGCFKTIYTLSLHVAREVGAPIIVTGLSRGQLFETRLAPELFNENSVETDSIDAIVLEARRTYHTFADTVSKRLNGDLFEMGEILEEVEFVDFYRYCDVPVAEVISYLERNISWVRPADTGRSTNCLINDVGIFVHKAQRRHHNYALPYSWDVRMGHKTVAEAVDELNDEIDVERVRKILDEIGFVGPIERADSTDVTCYYVSDTNVPPEHLRQSMARRLPREAVPSFFVKVDSIPLTANGKVDEASLPDPRAMFDANKSEPVEPSNNLEADLLAIWQSVLQEPNIGVDDNFYEIGGSSIAAIQIAARARVENISLSPIDIFRFQSVSEIAAKLLEVQPLSTKEKAKPRATISSDDKAKLSALLRKS